MFAKSFRTIESQARVFNRNMERIVGKTTGAPGRAAPATSARSGAAATAKTERAKTQATEREFRIRQQIQAKLNREEKAAQKAAVRDKQRAEVAKTQASEKAAREEMRIAKQVAAARRREEARDFRIRQSVLAKQNREERKLVAQAEKRQSGRAMRIGSIAAGGAAGAVRGIGGVAAGAAGIAGSFAVAGAIQRQLSVEAQAAELANQAFREGKVTNREKTQRSVLTQAKSLGAETGLGATSILTAMRSFQQPSGRLDIAQMMAPVIAEFADATGADIGDVGLSAGQTAMTMLARSPDMSAADVAGEIEKILSSMAGQAKAGAIEFRDLASVMGPLLSATAGFEGKLSDLASTMGAVAQISLAGGAADPREAMTAVKNFRDDLTQNADKFKKAGGSVGGVNVFRTDTKVKNTVLRDPVEIIVDTLLKTGGDLTKATKLFGKRARKAFEPFQEAFVKAGGGEAGKQQLMKVLETVRAEKMSASERKGSAAFRRGQTDRRLAKVTESFMNKVGDDLTPVIVELIPKFEQLVPKVAGAIDKLGGFVSWFAANPLMGLGALVMGKVSADLLQAGIGAGVKNTMLRILGGGGGGVGGVGGAGKAGKVAGAMNAAGGAVVAGAAVAGVITAVGVEAFNEDTNTDKGIGRRLNALRELERKSRGGKISQEALDKATGLKAGIQDEYLKELRGSTGLGFDFSDLFGIEDRASEKFKKSSFDEASALMQKLKERTATDKEFSAGVKSMADTAKQNKAAADAQTAAAEKLATAADTLSGRFPPRDGAPPPVGQ